MNKRLLSLVALLLVGLMALTACGGGSDTPDTAPDGDQPEETGETAFVEDDGTTTWNIKFGHGGSEETAQQVGALAMKEYLENNSDGRITVDIYPNNSIGNDRELCENVQGGSLEMCLANSVQVNFVPDATIYDLYFRFQTVDQAINKFRKDQDFINTMSQKYEAAGYKLTGFSVHGFRQTTANVEVHNPEDLAGLTFRVQENEYHIEGWKSIGATPTPFAFNELYTALQQGTVDAQENPIELIYSQKFYEQQKYVIMTNHQQQVQTWLMNAELFNSMPTNIQELIMDGVAVGCDAAETYALSTESEWRQAIEEAGTTFIELTEAEYNSFKDKVGPQWDKIQADVSAEVWEAYTN